METKPKCKMCGGPLKRPDRQIYCGNICQQAYQRGGIYLTSEFIAEVSHMHEKEGWTYQEIADFYKMDRHAIGKLVRGDY